MPPGLAQSIITTYAGGLVPIDGAPAIAQNVATPRAVTSDGAGGFYFTSHSKVYRVAADGTLTRIAGSGKEGFSGDGGPAVSAQFQLQYPNGIAVDGEGNLFIADSGNYRIRKVTPAGLISTVAGDGTVGLFLGDGGPATSAKLLFVSGIAADKDGNLLIADFYNNRIRKVTPAGIISTVAGDGTAGFSGDGGPATSAKLSFPKGIAVDKDGNLFIVDSGNTGNNRIRKVTPTGIISTVAGNGTPGFSGDGGAAISAQLRSPAGVAVDSGGSLLIADSQNNRIRKVTATGTITTVAGNGEGSASGDGGLAVLSSLYYPSSVAVDAAGNLFIADFHNERVRKVTPSGIISTFAGNGEYSFNGDGIPATSASIDPSSVAVSPAGDVFFTDSLSGRIRKVNPGGVISSVGASRFWYFFDYDGLAPSGEFCVAGVAADAEGNLYVAVTINQSIWKITPAGAISLVAGQGDGTYGFSGDGGTATSAKLSFPNGIAVDRDGNLFIADSYNNRIRKVTATGTITTVAGNGAPGFSGDGGPATSAKLWYPLGVAVDQSGNLFIADAHNNRIRKVTPAGIISTVVGNGIAGFSGDGGAATSAQLSYPSGVAVDTVGNLFIADLGNDRVRKVSPNLQPPTLTGLSSEPAAPGTTVEVTLTGTNFDSPLTISAGTDIAVGNIRLLTMEKAVATLTIAPSAVLGPRDISVTTRFGTGNASTLFRIVPPFPDLLVTTAPGRFVVGFNGSYTLYVRNVGTLTAPGPITVKNVLPVGLTYLSGTGSGWSCSSSGQEVTCENSGPLGAGASTSVSLTVAVGTVAASRVIHTVTVQTPGDLISSNNSASDDAPVEASASPTLNFSQTSLTSGGQSTTEIVLPAPFPDDVTGTLTLTFVPDAVNPSDDPAIQFATGGRQIAFVIPAGTLVARFLGTDKAGPLGFQAGTVAGTFTFDGVLETGNIQMAFSKTMKMPRQAPTVQAVQTSSQNGFSVSVLLSSNSREVTQLSLQFQTTPEVRLSCGSISGCQVSGSSVIFDVKTLFDVWYAADRTFGSLSTLSLPFSIQGAVQGKVWVSLRNPQGLSSPLSFSLP